MQKLIKTLKREIFPISLILILALARLIPHPPNFTPIVAVAIMSSYFFRNMYLSFAMLIIAMLLADSFIGFYDNIFFVYVALLFIVCIFYKIGKKINFKNLFIYGFFGSLVFFVVSNFGVWALGSHGAYDVPYEKNLKGLMECYVLAIPFFKNTLISTFLFTYSAYLANIFYFRISKKKIIF